MTKEFYESAISEAENLGELRIIHKFAVCDLKLEGFDYREVCRYIARRESSILLDMERSCSNV